MDEGVHGPPAVRRETRGVRGGRLRGVLASPLRAVHAFGAGVVTGVG